MNALLLGSLLYQSRLVPRILPLLGFIGAPLLVASTMATLFGANEYGSAMSGLLTIPIALWEFSLGVYLVVKGFRAEGLQQLGFEPVAPEAPASATAPRSELRPAARRASRSRLARRRTLSALSRGTRPPARARPRALREASTAPSASPKAASEDAHEPRTDSLLGSIRSRSRS